MSPPRKVKPTLLSAAPERNPVAHLKDYTPFFHPETLGARGTPQEIATRPQAVGVGYTKQPARAAGSAAIVAAMRKLLCYAHPPMPLRHC